jgi:hypothetical protein
MMYDENKPEDLDTDLEDHICDAWRYMLMSRPIKPRVAVKPDEFNKNPMSIFLDIKREDVKTPTPRARFEIISEDK